VGSGPHAPPTLSTAQIHKLATAAVELNSFGESYQDVVLHAAMCEVNSTSSQPKFQSFMGVWPAMALLNHACAPNAAVAVEGDACTMLVRAATPIAAGDEVTICYNGACMHELCREEYTGLHNASHAGSMHSEVEQVA
jgi:hypothetical protein